MTDNYDSSILLGRKELFFQLADTEMRLFQVKDGNRYQILIQENYKEDSPSFPKRYDVSDPKTKPVMSGSNWCLDRCIGVIQLNKTGTTFPDSDYDFVEVKQSFERVISEEEGFPPEWIKTRRISQHVDILYPFNPHCS